MCLRRVDALGDFAVQLRMKMMTLPGENFPIRRQALAMAGADSLALVGKLSFAVRAGI
jgi:hypothetical protein